MSRLNRTSLFLFLLLFFSLFVRLYFSYIIPYWQGPDEPTHYEYVHYLYQQYHIPVHQQWDNVELQRYIIHSMTRHHTWLYMDDFSSYNREHFLDHYSQIDNSPPLYYAVNAFFLSFFSPGDVESGLLYSRILNILLGICQLGILFYFTRHHLFRKDRTAWLFYLFWIVLLPQFIFINSVLNNDNLAYIIHFLFLWAAFSYHRFPDKRKLAAMILLTIVGFFTKRYLYFMPLFIPIIIVMTHKPRRETIIKGGIITLAVLFPLLLLYFYTSPVAGRELRELYYIYSYLREGGMLLLRDLFPFLDTLISSYFFRAGWMNVHFPLRIHTLLLLGVIISTFWFCRHYKGENKSLILLFTFFYIGLIFASDFLHPYRGPQGRYLFPVLPLFQFVMFQGILSRFSSLRNIVFKLSTAGWLVFFISSLVTIWYHYYFKYTFLR